MAGSQRPGLAGVGNWQAGQIAVIANALSLVYGSLPGNRTVKAAWTTTWTATAGAPGGFSKAVSCTAGSNGSCTLTTGTLKLSRCSVTLTGKGVTRTGFTYKTSLNNGPVADSYGTAIVINKP
jgi:hypothetical protein